jgi:DNA polymerase (family 10)
VVNKELSRLFGDIADLMEIQGGDRFRINSYRRVSRIIKELSEDISAIAEEGGLTDIEGVGKGTAKRIEEYLKEGKIGIHQELLKKVPAGLPGLLEIQGMGPKKVAAAWKELGVGDIEDLKRVIASGELAELPGMGAQSVKKIAEGIAFLETSGDRVPMGPAMVVAESLLETLKSVKGVKRVEFAGSLRRGRETVGDVDLLCEAEDGKAVIEAFTSDDRAQRVLAAGSTKGSITVDLSDFGIVGRRSKGELQVDCRVVSVESFGAALQYFSGSKEHNVRLREIAVKKGLKLNEYGLFKGDKQVAGKTEESIYEKLGVSFVPPEMREDRGEFAGKAAKEAGQKLVDLSDIRGDLHMHTVASDGACTIEEMAAAAKARGYAYMAITDHSKSSVIANGLSIERMGEQIEAVRAANKRIKGIEILVGCECDILAEGKLDYPDELLAECDIVVASVHSALGGEKKTVTKRTIRAIESEHVDIIGHPTGRLIGRRDAMDLDMQQVVDAAAANGTCLEINASWQRLDLKDTHARQALDAGVMISINTDAHHTDQLRQMAFGVKTARRAWLPKASVLNTMTVAGLKKWLKRKGA